MAAKNNLNLNLFNFKKTEKIKLPTKKSINVALVGIKKINLFIAIPAVIAIVAAAVMISKFAVIDRLASVSKAQAEVNSLQSRVDAIYEKMSEYGDLNDLYNHYTYSNMTSEELNRADRVKVMDLLKRDILSEATIESWSVTQNKVTVVVVDESLSHISSIVHTLDQEEIVNYCNVTTAQTEDKELTGMVRANIIIYLNAEPSDVLK